MIPIQELRVGNYYQTYFGVCMIEELVYDSFVDTYFDKGISIESMHPIELTKEILLELGFNNCIKDRYLIKENIIVDIRKSIIYYNVNNELIILEKCNKVHHLQNIYFDIKQKEIQKDK